jgi:hypothetical protein
MGCDSQTFQILETWKVSFFHPNADPKCDRSRMTTTPGYITLLTIQLRLAEKWNTRL